MLKYTVVFAFALVCLSMDLWADMPIRPIGHYNPFLIGVFFGFESQFDHYSVNPDELLPNGFDPDWQLGEELYWGLGIYIPVTRHSDGFLHTLLLSAGHHQSEFEFQSPGAEISVLGGPENDIVLITGDYLSRVEREHIELSVAWHSIKRNSRWFFHAGMSIQYTFNDERREQVRITAPALPTDPNAEPYRLPFSNRFDVNEAGIIADLRQEFFEFDPWTFGVVAGGGYYFGRERLRYGPKLELACNLTNIDGNHAGWRRFSTRISLEISYAIGRLYGYL